MSSRRTSRLARILVAAPIVLLVIHLGLALAAGQAGTLAGLLLVAAFGTACYRAGRRPQAQATQGRPRTSRPPARRRRSPLGGRIARDAARLLISRR